MNTYNDGDKVTTRDGATYRVIYQSGERVFVKPQGDKAKFIDISKITHHEPKKKVPA